MSKVICEKQLVESRKRSYGKALLIGGIMLTSFGVYELPTIWTSKSSLIEIKGTLRSGDIYTTNATDRRGHSSRMSELIFYLNESNQKYRFAENIGDDFVNKKYESILNGLKRADTISVWIKKSEAAQLEPKVFQVDNEKTTLLEFESVQTEKSSMTAFMLALGVISILGYFWARFPDKFRQLTGMD